MKTTDVKEFPIMMARSESVNRTLDGTKTQTRRIVSRTNSLLDGRGVGAEHWKALDFSTAFVDRGPSPAGNAGPYLHAKCSCERLHGRDGGGVQHRVYPRWQKGDLLWVREAFCWKVDPKSGQVLDDLWYRADGTDVLKTEGGFIVENKDGSEASPWISPIFMPRKASRIQLEVLEVRIERVQDISERDACAEGCGSPITRDCKVPKFAAAWNEMHGPDAWERNDWVQAITYRRVSE